MESVLDPVLLAIRGSKKPLIFRLVRQTCFYCPFVRRARNYGIGADQHILNFPQQFTLHIVKELRKAAFGNVIIETSSEH
jgi:hypothetical protein